MIWLLAGAGPATSRRSTRYHRDLLKTLGSPRPRIAYVGAAHGDGRAFAAMIKARIFGLTAEVVDAPFTRRGVSAATLRARLDDADLVFFSGGDVDAGMAAVEERGLGAHLRTLAAQGKPMEGISAGAIMLGRHWVRFPERGEPRPFDCLGVVPTSFDTHGEEDGWSELKVLARALAGGDEQAVYGIPSHGAARWDGASLAALGLPLARFRCGAEPRRLPDLPAGEARAG